MADSTVLALTLLRQAVEIGRTALGESHPDYAQSLNSLAVLLQDMGDYAAALAVLRHALEIHSTALGEGHPDYAADLHNLAGLYRDMGDYAAALPLFRQALEIRRTVLGESHPDYAASLNNLAMLHQDMGDHAAALRLLRQALEIHRTAQGESHPAYAKGLNNLALLYAAMGRASEAIPLMEQATAIDDRMIGQILAVGSDRQRIAYLNAVRGNVHVFLSLVLQHFGDSRHAIHAAFELVLRRKAAAEAAAEQRDAVLEGRYPGLERKLRELAALRMQIVRKTLAGPGPEGLESQMRTLGKWYALKLLGCVHLPGRPIAPEYGPAGDRGSRRCD
jgi:tetratricopeptide (TPR) repeat protein